LEEAKNRLEHVPVHERLFIGSCLALVGGFLDAYTYLTRGGVFANAQTGNMVLMGLDVSQGDFTKAAYHFVPIFAFYLGVLVSELIKKFFNDRQLLEWQQVIIIAETGLLFLAGFASQQVPNAIVNVTISFICSMQVNSFRRTKGMPYATTMCTGNLRSAAEHFFLFLTAKDQSAGAKCGRYLFIILMFCTGAALGGILAGLWGNRAIWLCCLLLLVTWVTLYTENLKSG
jgi:uncharacterized membrane protein YoaK (UPF0700 family)